MEFDTSHSLCALDNPVVAGMQFFHLVNLALCGASALLLLFRLLRHAPALPPWCRAFSVAAIAVHGFWCLVSVFVLSAGFVHSVEDGATFLLSQAFALITASSFLGLVLAWRVRHYAATDWTPALTVPSASTSEAPDPVPHA